MLEFQEFNAAWDSKMKEYEERATELLEAMRQRHQLDYSDFRRKAESEPAKKPKFSRELLDLRRIELTLAKQCEYGEAQKIKVQADAMEAGELDRLHVGGLQHLGTLEAKFLHKQDQELSALRQRIQSGSEEQRKARQADLERLLQRYHNVKHELEAQQVMDHPLCGVTPPPYPAPTRGSGHGSLRHTASTSHRTVSPHNKGTLHPHRISRPHSNLCPPRSQAAERLKHKKGIFNLEQSYVHSRINSSRASSARVGRT